jgi:hypothetical protein
MTMTITTTTTKNTTAPGKRPSLSLDAWAVIVALVLALIVKLDIFRGVPW